MGIIFINSEVIEAFEKTKNGLGNKNGYGGRIWQRMITM